MKKKKLLGFIVSINSFNLKLEVLNNTKKNTQKNDKTTKNTLKKLIAA